MEALKRIVTAISRTGGHARNRQVAYQARLPQAERE